MQVRDGDERRHTNVEAVYTEKSRTSTELLVVLVHFPSLLVFC